MGLGIEGLLTIGPLFLLAGIGLAVLYLAWLNRAGPGEVCETLNGGVPCTEQWSPWPLVIVAALLILATVLLVVLTGRNGARTGAI